MSKIRQATFLCLILLVATNSFSQYKRAKGLKKPKPANFVNAFRLTGQLGGTSYYGDLRTKTIQFDFRHNFFVGGSYRINESLSVRADLGWFRLSADDEGGEYPDRNLSFRTECYELTAKAVYDVFHQYKLFHKRHLINPYGFVGFGVLMYTPKAELDGQWYNLRPLETEGVSYGSATMVFPVGIGFSIKYSPHLSFGIEGSYTFTLTDYLDDVSGPNYKDNSSFDDPIAARLADRGPEIGRATYGTGAVRGDPENNDGYFLLGVRVEYVIHVPRQSYNINKNPSRFRVIKSIKKR